ncbi:MAG: universal stress protein [Saccharothrix sp.]|nr:universal stress protein [Saccharothrix sp.]
MSNGGAIVVGVDGTGPSERAAGWAARQAAVLGEPLVLVYALRGPMPAETYLPTPARITAVQPGMAEEPVRRWAHDMLDGLAERCREHTGAEVRVEVVPGDPAEALTLAVDRATFIVVGHSDEGGLARFLLESTAQRLTRSCPWPVVVVRDEAVVDDRAPGPVVVGADGSPAGARATRFAFAFAARHGVEVTVVHVVGDTVATASQAVGTWDEAALREGSGPADAVLVECAKRYPGVAHQVMNLPGVPQDVLFDVSAGAGLLVVGSHGKGAVRRAFLGSVSRAVVDRATCPVAVLPPETSTAGAVL